MSSPYHLIDVSVGDIKCEPPCEECLEHFFEADGVTLRETVAPGDEVYLPMMIRLDPCPGCGLDGCAESHLP